MGDPNVHGISLDLALGDQGLVDIIVLQWHTPDPDPANGLKIPGGLAAERGQILENLRQWLTSSFERETEPRPLFIVAPELSFPMCHTGLARQLVAGLNRPTVLIAGLEYLSCAEYLSLLDSLPDMPTVGTWRNSHDPTRSVNAAAIWVREATGTVKAFVQRKRNPAHIEATYLSAGRDVLLFRTNNQSPGSRLNFGVQLCADFTSAECVTSLRRSATGVLGSAPLDMMFVIQHNKSYDANQFRQGSRDYFSAPHDQIETGQGCILFVNNASAAPGKAADWGRSMFRFRWRDVCRPPRNGQLPTWTYWQNDCGDFNHQEVVFREYGPGLYHVVYKPVYLHDPTPGQGEPRPFPEELSRFVPLKGSTIGYDDGAHLRRIPPVIHWLEGEWKEELSHLTATLSQYGIDVQDASPANAGKRSVAEECQKALGNVLTEWLTAFNWADHVGRNAVDWYLRCVADKRWAADPEPNRWSSDVARGMKRFMLTHTLMWLGSGGFDEPSLLPKPHEAQHAIAGGDLSVTLLWGASMMPVERMIVLFENALRERAPLSLLRHRWMLVLVQPDGSPVKERVRERLQILGASIVEAAPPTDAGVHLMPTGEVARVDGPKMYTLCDGDLIQNLSDASDAASLRQGLEATIRDALTS